jgi:hypothetical protein
MRALLLAAAAALASAQSSGPDLQITTCDSSSRFQGWQYNGTDKTIRFLPLSNNVCIDIDNYGTTPGSVFWTYSCHQSDKVRASNCYRPQAAPASAVDLEL